MFITAGSASRLLQVQTDTGQSATPEVITLAAGAGVQVTAIGFNTQDNFIYGLNRNTRHLVRIGREGLAEDLGLPPNLDSLLEYNAGDVHPEGGRMFVIGRAPNGVTDRKLFTIRLEPPYNAGSVDVVSIDDVKLTDITFDPIFGRLIGFDDLGKSLVNVSVGGTITNTGYEPQVGTNVGGLFFDRQGRLYGFGESTLQEFDRFSGAIIAAHPIPESGFSDGCGCPYRLRSYKEIHPKVVVPCSEVTITYRFDNTAGVSYGNKFLFDELPPQFEITAIEHEPLYGEFISGIGSNRLEMNDLDVLLEADSIVIRVNVGVMPGLFSSQANTYNYPLGLGIAIQSDDPATLVPEDPTSVLVVDSAQLILHPDAKICPGGIVTLEAAAGNDYLWSDGSTGRFFTTHQTGDVWVEVSGDCGKYRDTLSVQEAGKPTLNLGDPLTVSFADKITLFYATNATGNLQFQWAAAGSPLDCETCPFPSASITMPSVYSLTLTDGYGCTAVDSLSVSLDDNRSVYAPTAFSPNDDGINDVFFLQGKADFTIRNMRVFDRWGGMVFERNDTSVNALSDGWDGSANGKPLGEGVYFWEALIEFPDGQTDWHHAAVLLLH